MIYIQIDESLADQPGLDALLDQAAPPPDETTGLPDDPTTGLPDYKTVLEKAAQQTLTRAGSQPDAELTLVLSDDAHLQALNLQFLGIDAPTDVLSFPAGEVDPDDDALYLGDVIISYPRAVAQAQAAGHPPQAELQLLVVHGVLHLLGYDHADEQEKAEMWAVQAQVLADLGWTDLSVA